MRPLRFPHRIVSLLASLLLLAACSGDETSDTPSASVAPTSTATTPAPTDATDTEDARSTAVDGVLASGPDTHLGATWFSPPNAEFQDLVLERWEEATAASSVGRVMIDWRDVEPEAGDYRFEEIEEQLQALRDNGLDPMVSVVAIDVSGTDVPQWLGEFDPVPAAAAYLTMAEQLAPLLDAYDVWLFAIANEPPLADDEDLDRGDFATFVELVTEGMDTISPGLATTFTFAGTDAFIDDPAIDRMVAAVDVLSVNHYCLQPDLRVIDLTETTTTIDRFVDRAAELPIVFQEFGCPAAISMGSSDAYQLAWFETALAHIGDIEQVRAAFVFEFLDWSQATFDLSYGDVIDVLDAEVGDGFAQRFEDWLLTSGLVREDGTTRPVFDLFLETAPAMATN